MKVEFSAFPKAFAGNVATFVGADKQLQATARSIDTALGGALVRSIEASRFTGAKNQTLAVLGQANFGRLMLLGTGRPRDLDARAAEALGGLVAAEANASGLKDVTIVVDAIKGNRAPPALIAAHIALGA
ncbi:MAG TPA: M17 family peptidase N-terminal domain-containing protein, partial [Reyranella sp.]|nr:M17 family peptidase N-terminal domain-containing protein [Reyranella sp.]